MTYKSHFKQNLIIGIPVMISQLGIISVNFFDTFMVGHIVDSSKGSDYPSIALGGVSLGNAIFFSIFVFAMGISMAVSPLVSQANAKNNKTKIQEIFSHGMILSFLIGIILFILFLPIYPFLHYFIKDKEVLEVTKGFLFINMISLIPVMIFQGYKQLAEGMHFTKGVTYSVLLANVINVALNYLLVNGNLGFPQWGVNGSAFATLVARICMIFFIIFFLNKNINTKDLIVLRFKKLKTHLFRKMLALGFPISFQLLFEVSAFSVAAFICEKYGTKDLAAHHITLQVVSMSFLMCTGFSVASTIQIGKFKGLNDLVNLRKSGFSNLYSVIIFMFTSGIILILFRNQIPTLFSEDSYVIKTSATLFIVAALFQLSDGIQVVALGSLRGLQEVRIPTIISFCSYWILAVPLGYYLTIIHKMGAIGVWIALGIGLTNSAILLVYRFNKLTTISNPNRISKKIDNMN